MRSLYISVILVFILTILLTLSGCSISSHEAHKQGAMNKEAHKHGTMEKDAQGSGTKLQTSCPVMGGDIDKTIYADHQGKRVYFCCKMCIDKFKEDPEKYMKKL